MLASALFPPSDTQYDPLLFRFFLDANVLQQSSIQPPAKKGVSALHDLDMLRALHSILLWPILYDYLCTDILLCLQFFLSM